MSKHTLTQRFQPYVETTKWVTNYQRYTNVPLLSGLLLKRSSKVYNIAEQETMKQQ